MIRKARSQDIASILKITNACAIDLVSKNIQQWHANYPNKITFNKDLSRNELYVIEDKSIQGCVVITTLMDTAYQTVSWLTENTSNLYIHRLAIHPDFQGQGLAQKLMDFAENFAIRNNYTSIRLDTFSKNKRNQKFYELRGYKRLGEIFFPQQSKYPFYCYELIL